MVFQCRYGYRVCDVENPSCSAPLINLSNTIFSHAESGLNPCTAYVATIHPVTEAGPGQEKEVHFATTSRSIVRF